MRFRVPRGHTGAVTIQNSEQRGKTGRFRGIPLEWPERSAPEGEIGLGDGAGSYSAAAFSRRRKTSPLFSLSPGPCRREPHGERERERGRNLGWHLIEGTRGSSAGPPGRECALIGSDEHDGAGGLRRTVGSGPTTGPAPTPWPGWRIDSCTVLRTHTRRSVPRAGGAPHSTCAGVWWAVREVAGTAVCDSLLSSWGFRR
jgi:hypothetical protein